MGLRPAKCYRSTDKRPYTRTAKTVHKKNYVGASPAMLIRQFNMGNPTVKYDKIGDLLSDQAILIRDNAVESTRIAINKVLVAELGKEGFFMKIRVYPYEVLRENKQAQGAGADRVSEGMSHSFGKAIGRAIRVRKNQVLMSVLFFAKDEKVIMEALSRAKAKLPCGTIIKIHEDLESIGTLPRKTRAMIEEEVEEEVEEEEGAEGEEKKEGEGKAEEGKEEGKAGEKKGEGKKEGAKEEGKKEEKGGDKKEEGKGKEGKKEEGAKGKKKK